MLIATLGWLGTLGTFGAYVLLSRGWLQSHSLTYSTLNVIGGLLAACASAAYGAWPSVVSNIVWAAVGLHAAGQTLAEDHRAEWRRADRPARVQTTDPVPQDCWV
jgi:hypothetical protein